MSDIWKVIAEIGVETHPDRVATIADKIGSLNSSKEFEKAKSSFGTGTDHSIVDRLGIVWKNTPILTPPELAAALRGASNTASMIENRESIEMVWTGPSTGLVPSRHTEQVLIEVIVSAQRRLFIVSFIAYDIETVVKALQNAVERNIRVDILLESSKSEGGKAYIDSISTFKDRIPSANFYRWELDPRSSEEPNGVVHAKCAVADGKMAFITSANLTTAAMERNMEMGVLIRGGNLPEKLDQHMAALVTTGIIRKI